MRAIRLYDLRHTSISLMAAGGADLKAVSEVAGHANVAITRNVYQHINRNQRAAALAALTDALAERPEGVSPWWALWGSNPGPTDYEIACRRCAAYYARGSSTSPGRIDQSRAGSLRLPAIGAGYTGPESNKGTRRKEGT